MDLLLMKISFFLLFLMVSNSEIIMEVSPDNYVYGSNNDYPVPDHDEEIEKDYEEVLKVYHENKDEIPRPERKIIGPDGDYEYIVLPDHEHKEMTAEEYDRYMRMLQQYREKEELL